MDFKSLSFPEAPVIKTRPPGSRSKKPAPDLAQKVRTACQQHGLLVEIGGHYSNVVRFLPPLILKEELAKKGIGKKGDGSLFSLVVGNKH